MNLRIDALLHGPRTTAGLSLIELMVALIISSLLMLGLVSSFKTSSDAQKAIEKAGMLIENGRYAVNLLSDDIKHAGYYGQFFDLGDPPTTLQDPCETGSTGNLRTAMGMPLQGYTAASLTARPVISATSCDEKGLFTNANIATGSDMIVVRRASTEVFTGVPVDNEVYIQANNREVNILLGNEDAGAVSGTTAKGVDNVTRTSSTPRKYPRVSGSDYADTRKFIIHVYFVAPCSVGSGASGVCAAGDDDIPTLKRLELTAVDTDDDGEGDTTAMDLVPLVEGIEYMKFEYGLDTSPSTVNSITGLTGDSVPDTYVTSPSAAQWPYVTTVRVYLLVRSTETTAGYTDAKSYTLGTVGGGTAIAAANDAYTRHVFSAEVRPANLAGRREIPE
jgi:type IV pilus assembly protein PilW